MRSTKYEDSKVSKHTHPPRPGQYPYYLDLQPDHDDPPHPGQYSDYLDLQPDQDDLSYYQPHHILLPGNIVPDWGTSPSHTGGGGGGGKGERAVVSQDVYDYIADEAVTNTALGLSGQSMSNITGPHAYDRLIRHEGFHRDDILDLGVHGNTEHAAGIAQFGNNNNQEKKKNCRWLVSRRYVALAAALCVFFASVPFICYMAFRESETQEPYSTFDTTVTTPDTTITTPDTHSCNITIQQHYYGSPFFNLSWSEMLAERGSPTPGSDYWAGLERMHQLTKDGRYKLRLDLQAVNGTRYWEEYNRFVVGDSDSIYRLTVSGYTGNTGTISGNSMLYHNDMMFTTYDRDNDRNSERNCASLHGGGWWYNACRAAPLNGSPSDNFWIFTGREVIYLFSSVMRLLCQ